MSHYRQAYQIENALPFRQERLARYPARRFRVCPRLLCFLANAQNNRHPGSSHQILCSGSPKLRGCGIFPRTAVGASFHWTGGSPPLFCFFRLGRAFYTASTFLANTLLAAEVSCV
jgi:hypothetical protein